MSAIENNILTITEPTIEVDEFDIVNIEKTDSSTTRKNDIDTNEPNASNIVGNAFPAIRINGYDFGKNDIINFSLFIGDFLPRLTVTVEDTKGIFNLSQFPRDGDTLNLVIRASAEDVYKPIRMDFDIINIDAPPVSNESQGAPHDAEADVTLTPVIYTFECRAKIPDLFTEYCKGYSNMSSFDSLETISEELQLGFASNIANTDDEMTRISAYDNRFSLISDIVESSYKDDDSFFTSFIDQYYYLNFVELNRQFEYDEELEDSIISLSAGFQEHQMFDDIDEKDTANSKLFITNLEKGSSGTDRYIEAYSLINNSAEVTILNGYKRNVQYYDDSVREFREFTIDPLTSTNLPNDLYPLRGRIDEDRHEKEIKFKYLGTQSSNLDDGNVHDNFIFAHVHNYQNLQELNKLRLKVVMQKANMTLYRFQKLPVLIYETDDRRIRVLEQRKEFNKNEGIPHEDDKSDIGNPEALSYGSPMLNDFLTGIYVIGDIEYIFMQGDISIKQKMTLLKREWKNPI